MIQTLKIIAAHLPAEVRFHFGNEGIMYKYGLDDFILIHHYGEYHGRYDDTKYTLTGN